MNKWDIAHIHVARVYANLSYAMRLSVGAVIVKNDSIIGIGYNGMPSGWSNVCESKEYMPVMEGDSHQWPFDPEEEYPFEEGESARYRLVTHPEVLHAEANAIAKVARGTVSGEGATMYITHSPCLNCAKLIYQAGIVRVVYGEEHRNSDGLEFLEMCGIKSERLDLDVPV